MNIARANQEVERPVRTITIYDIEAWMKNCSCKLQQWTLCSILCHDIAERQQFGCMSS